MIQVEQDDTVLVVTVHETRLDAESAMAFLQDATDAVKTRPRVVFDLSAVGFMDSTGIGALVGVTQSMETGGGVAVFGLTPAVEMVFTLLRMDMLFAIAPDRTSALAQVRDA
ncbi:STAS domain-containing protein [Roseospira visakhapatnamensis]|uniref:Anti-sigma B factor antagonist n=1 Tax=Roseospira visakhapatnamensis TaxID=390880 RepID=A0A7W6RDK8_9PROT|nr:STAS domain-containing protein [Roseospira visakhapatnamensis]MBB4266497.1 anti-sigma B factor antagonist [Roseospira visakhapatnamensis]